MASYENNGNKMNETSHTNPLSDHNKRNKRSSSINDDNSGCNCKKSQCMKLYCECFRAENLCNKDSYTCKDCQNNVEHKEYVNEKKKEIELRDPHAFKPKIIVDNAARRRKGCNCSKSECKNKYCGYFSFGVGCSLLCHCLSCKNEHGTKDSSLVPKEQKPSNENNDCTLIPKEQEPVNKNNGNKNAPERMDNGSSSQSHHPVVDYGNFFTPMLLCCNSSDIDMNMKKEEKDYYPWIHNSNVNNINMPIIPSNQVMPVSIQGSAAVSIYSDSVVENRVPTPHYQLQTPKQIFSTSNNNEQQNTDIFGDLDWQEQSTFRRAPNFYDDNNNFFELHSLIDSFILMDPTMQNSQQYQPDQNYDFQQKDAENIHHPHIDGHGPSFTNGDCANFSP